MKLVEATPAEREGVRTTNDAYLILKQEMVKLLQSDEPLHIDEARSAHSGAGGGRQRLWAKRRPSARWPTGTRDAGAKWCSAQPTRLRCGHRPARPGARRRGRDRAGARSDPGVVVYDAIRASQESRKADLLIVDTAGRLQTKYNLMQELEKIGRVGRQNRSTGALYEVLLVLDASTGQNAISQAKAFKDAAGVTGIVLTKLDGTSKGGAVLSIKDQLGVPVRFVGTGEKLGDFAYFDPVAFVEGLLGE
ncbi:MAG: signal recognition particle-docking protein FtsY [Caldilineaceae bacterium]